MIRYARLPVAFNLLATQNELLSYKDENWKAHFNTWYYEGSWTALALRSPGGTSENIIPDLTDDTEFANTPVMESFPSVKGFLLQIKCPVMSVRFLNLQAGAKIKKHKDHALAFEKGEARFHIPVFTNPGVEFYVEDDLIPFKEGECWYMNANLAHRVSNNGTTDRIHLVFDCKVNDWLSDLIGQSDQISHKEEEINPDLPQIIMEMRRQNTTTTNQLADKLEQQLLESSKKIKSII